MSPFTMEILASSLPLKYTLQSFNKYSSIKWPNWTTEGLWPSYIPRSIIQAQSLVGFFQKDEIAWFHQLKTNNISSFEALSTDSYIIIHCWYKNPRWQITSLKSLVSCMKLGIMLQDRKPPFGRWSTRATLDIYHFHACFLTVLRSLSNHSSLLIESIETY